MAARPSGWKAFTTRRATGTPLGLNRSPNPTKTDEWIGLRPILEAGGNFFPLADGFCLREMSARIRFLPLRCSCGRRGKSPYWFFALLFAFSAPCWMGRMNLSAWAKKARWKFAESNRFYYIQVLHINTECKLTKYVLEETAWDKWSPPFQEYFNWYMKWPQGHQAEKPLRHAGQPAPP